MISKDNILNTVDKTQRCQRNWDLNKQIPKEDLDTIIYAIANAPSKQNLQYFNLHVVTNREKIESIYEGTNVLSGRRKNPQVLANVLFVFTQVIPNEAVYFLNKKEDKQYGHDKDLFLCTGIAAGYGALVAGLLGYETGFCKCFPKTNDLKKILNTKEAFSLMLGVGCGDKTKHRREDHMTKEIVESFNKNEQLEIFYHA
jgi:nitroreductase